MVYIKYDTNITFVTFQYRRDDDDGDGDDGDDDNDDDDDDDSDYHILFNFYL